MNTKKMVRDTSIIMDTLFKVRGLVTDADWDESKHGRSAGGQFGASNLPDRSTEPDPHKRLDVYRKHHKTAPPDKPQGSEFNTPYTRALAALVDAGSHASNHHIRSDWGDKSGAKRSASGVHRKLDEYKKHMTEHEQRYTHDANFKSSGAYHKWLAFGHMHGKFSGNEPVKISNQPHKVEHDADWDESKHSRSSGGQFGTGSSPVAVEGRQKLFQKMKKGQNIENDPSYNQEVQRHKRAVAKTSKYAKGDLVKINPEVPGGFLGKGRVLGVKPNGDVQIEHGDGKGNKAIHSYPPDQLKSLSHPGGGFQLTKGRGSDPNLQANRASEIKQASEAMARGKFVPQEEASSAQKEAASRINQAHEAMAHGKYRPEMTGAEVLALSKEERKGLDLEGRKKLYQALAARENAKHGSW